MADLSKLKLNGTEYNLKDTVARNVNNNIIGMAWIDADDTNRRIYEQNVSFNTQGASDYSSPFLFFIKKGTSYNQNGNTTVKFAGQGNFHFVNSGYLAGGFAVIPSGETIKFGYFYIGHLNDGTINLYPLVTTDQVNSLISTAIGNINSFEVSVVSSLPASDIKDHTIYFISNGSTYDEYMYINNAWEKLGSTDIDLSGYLKITDIADWAKAATKPSYTASEVGAAASIHTHGNITNAGDITTNVAIANGDRLVINDESEGKLNNSSITFGTKTTQYLANNGTWKDLTTISNSSGVGQGIVAAYVNKVILEASTESPTFAQNTLTLTGTATTIKKVVTPTEDGDAANKKYVDDAVAGLTVPTKVSDLTNDSGFITSAPVTSVNGQTGAVTLNIPSATTVTQTLTSGTKIGEVNGTSLYAPAGGSVTITNTLASGTLIATINGTNIYAPSYTNGDGVSY